VALTRGARLVALIVLTGCGAAPTRTLRVCADPNNLPFSNQQGQGFENRLAALVARDLNARLEYTWWAQRRGFLRNTLRAGKCDLVMGQPYAAELALTGRPYYRSVYGFLARADRGLALRSLDDPVLRGLRIGVHVIGDDYANTPPAEALARRGLVAQVVGYSIYGDYSKPNPPSRLVDAVARGEVDLAIIWGPFAGFFAPREPVQLVFTPVEPRIDLPFLPMVFDIAPAVRREDTLLLHEVDAVLEHRRDQVNQILDEFGVPRVDEQSRFPTPDSRLPIVTSVHPRSAHTPAATVRSPGADTP